MGPRTKKKINTVARTKLGVYSCPSLRIVENQEYGKDKRHIFCPELLKTNSFSFLFVFFFLFFFFFYFFGFFFLFFLPPPEDTYLIGLTIHKLPKAGLILFHLGLPLIANTFHFSSGLTSNCQYFLFFIWAYL